MLESILSVFLTLSCSFCVFCCGLAFLGWALEAVFTGASKVGFKLSSLPSKKSSKEADPE